MDGDMKKAMPMDSACLEYGVALETLCEFLMEAQTQTVHPHLVSAIQRLHSKMGVDDDCVRCLEQEMP